MESAKSRAIFAALLRLLLDCSRQCLGSMKHTEQAMQHERRSVLRSEERAGKCRGGWVGQVKQTRANMRGGAG